MIKARSYSLDMEMPFSFPSKGLNSLIFRCKMIDQLWGNDSGVKEATMPEKKFFLLSTIHNYAIQIHLRFLTQCHS